MDLFGVLRAIGALLTVLGLLAGAVWLARRYGLALPALAGGASPRRLALVERLAIDGRSSIVLLRRDGTEHLVLLAATGASVIESGIVPPVATASGAAGAALFGRRAVGR
jgi:hypothetical protein